jgi:tRNA (mo5U34)-methyltransferase
VPPFLKANDEQSLNWLKYQIEILNEKGYYHSIELPDGTVIDGVQPLAHLRERISRFPLPQDLSGKRVLDVGAWDGWFSFEAERRGADVTAIDCVDMERFRLAHTAIGSRVDYRVMDVDELSPMSIGRFDIILFFGVLYHLRHPLLGLERICQLTRDVAFVESFVIDDGPGSDSFSATPVLQFYEYDELLGQFDNWFGPSTTALLAMCRSAGFARVQLETVKDQRAHVSCYRHWEPVGQVSAAAPKLGAAANNRDWTSTFQQRKDSYVCCFFESSQSEIRRDDMRLELDGYGVPCLAVLATAPGAWQANFRLPWGLDDGEHEVRLRTAQSDYSNTVRIEIQPAAHPLWL